MDRELDIAAAGGASLAGALAGPPQATAAALILNGSGPLDRDSNMPGQALDIAHALAADLAARGIASLRFDKRGVGRSGGEYLSTGFDEEADDAAAALDALTAQAAPGARLYVIGHSVGGAITIRLASRRSDLAGAVLLSTACCSGEAVMRRQSQRFAETMRGPSRLLAPVLLWRQADARRRLLASRGDVLRIGGSALPARWMREYMAYDPVADLGAVRCPVLALTGGDDVQVEASDVARFGEALSEGFTGLTPEGISHLLRRSCGPPGLASYPEELRSPPDAGVIGAVGDWIEAQIAR